MERFRGVSLVLLLLAALMPVNYSYKILMVSPSHSKSHLIIASALLKGLAEEGHNVTMISSFPQKEKIPNYRDVYLEVPQKLKKLFDDSLASESATYSLTSIKDMIVGIVDYANMTMGLPEFQRIMKEEQFDAVIAAPLGGNMFSGLAEHFHCPLVYFFPIRTMITHSYGAGNPLQISSVPSLFSSLGSAMTFRERVKNYLFTGFEAILFTVNDLIQWHYYNSNFPQPRYPSYHEASRNASLILSAHHFSQGPIANLPQIVEIGGIQMDTKLDPLPETLQRFLDEATEGAIFFSFGTNVQLKRQNPEKVSSILKALEKTGRKVLLKYDTDERIPGLSKNILTSAWVPQRTVLAHPNVKLFVTHGGLGSIMESKYYGVPVVGISVFADQHGNVAGAAKEGWGVALDMATLTEAKLTAALAEALGNSSYAETVKKLSDVYRDRPMGPMKTAIYWIEYVIRHQGAPQMRSPAKDLNFLQRYSADVIGLLAVVLLLFVIFLKFIVTLIFRLIKGAAVKVIRGSVGGDKKDK